MSKRDDFLDEKPPADFDAKVMRAVSTEMQPARRRFFWWLAPAALGAAGIVAVKILPKAKPDPEVLVALEEGEEIPSPEDFELLENLDLIEDLEELDE